MQAAVRFAAGTGLALSVRGGGHGFQGFATNDDGLVIDLGELADVAVVDEQRQRRSDRWRRHLGAGRGRPGAARPGDLLGRHHERRRRRPDAVGRHRLEGEEVRPGAGQPRRRGGRDRCRGRGPTRARSEHADLFWALRGGGGNVGIVTAFEFTAHRTTEVFHGSITFPASEAEGVLRGLGGPPPLGTRRAHLRGEPREPLHGRARGAGRDPGRRRQRRPRVVRPRCSTRSVGSARCSTTRSS